jgi:hypothetical protein
MRVPMTQNTPYIQHYGKIEDYVKGFLQFLIRKYIMRGLCPKLDPPNSMFQQNRGRIPAGFPR